MATIGEIAADLPVGVWHDLPEHGCRLRHYENPTRVEVIPVPVIHVTRAEFNTERFWAERIDPVARAHGIDTDGRDYGLRIDSGNPAQQLLQDGDGRLVLVVNVSEAQP
jgi:hypothetical protein